MDSHKVPRDIINKMVQEYCQEYPDESYETLSIRAGLNPNYISGSIKNLETNEMEFRYADKILCAINRYDEWWEEPLVQYYWNEQKVPPDKAKPIKCQNPRCEEWFSLGENHGSWGRKYCNDNCKSMHWKILRDLCPKTNDEVLSFICEFCGKECEAPKEAGGKAQVSRRRCCGDERCYLDMKAALQQKYREEKKERDRKRWHEKGKQARANDPNFKEKARLQKQRQRKKANAKARQGIPEDDEVKTKNGA